MVVSEWGEEERCFAERVGAGGELGGDASDVDFSDLSELRDLADSGAQAVALEYCRMGGDGLLISISVGERLVSLWTEEASWCNWLVPHLATPAFDRIPPQLKEALGHLAFATLDGCLSTTALAPVRYVSITRGTRVPMLGLALVLREGGRLLPLALVDWPPSYVDALVTATQIRRIGRCPQNVRVVAAAGWCRVSRTELSSLQRGDALALEATAQVESGEAWLMLGRPLARVKFCESGWRVETIDRMERYMESPFEPQILSRVASETDVRVTVVVEVGRAEISIDTLRQLQVGQLIDLGLDVAGQVTLTQGGREIAAGSLLRIGEKMFFRID